MDDEPPAMTRRPRAAGGGGGKPGNKKARRVVLPPLTAADGTGGPDVPPAKRAPFPLDESDEPARRRLSNVPGAHTRRSQHRFSARRTQEAPGLPPARPNVDADTPLDTSDLYRIMQAFMTTGLVRTQMDSFETMMMRGIPTCFNTKPVEVAQNGNLYTVKVESVRYNPPTVQESNGVRRRVQPHECMVRRIPFNIELVVTVLYTIRNQKTGELLHSARFMDRIFDAIPCMVGSRFCTTRENPMDARLADTDHGGYFVLGAEKVVLGQEQPRRNHPTITRDGQDLMLEDRSFNQERRRSTSTLYVRLHAATASDDVAVRRCTVPRITAQIPFVSGAMALQAIFKLLGVETQAAMAEHVAAPTDPAWFRQRVEEVLVNDLDAALQQADVVMRRMAHDRGQSRRAAQAARQQRQQATAAAARAKATARATEATAAAESARAAAAAAAVSAERAGAAGTANAAARAAAQAAADKAERAEAAALAAEAKVTATAAARDDDNEAPPTPSLPPAHGAASRDPALQAALEAQARAEAALAEAQASAAAALAAHTEAEEEARAAFATEIGAGAGARAAADAHVAAQTAATRAALALARAASASAAEAADAAAADAAQARAEAEAAASRRQVMGLLRTEFLPHQGLEETDNTGKAVVFGLCVRRLLGVYYAMDGMDVDSRDHYMHRRQESIDSMLTPIFRSHLQAWRHRLAVQMCRSLREGNSYIDVCRMLPANIGAQLESAFKSGNFSITRGNSTLDSVSQTLSHIEPHSDLAHARRTDVPMPRDGRSIKPRMLNLSAGGATGPSETPEGEGCGRLRNLALLSGVRVGYDTRTLERAVISTGLVEPVGDALGAAPVGRMVSAPVFVNGRLVGLARHGPDSAPPGHGDPADRLLHTLRRLRATQDLPCDISLYRTYGGAATTPHGEVHVNGDAGSYWWALLVVRRLPRLRELLDTVTHDDGLWQLLLAEGLVELINKDEEVFCTRVAMSLRDLRTAPPNTYTHVVIHPSQVLSLTTNRIPLPEFNAAPRVTYAASMIKQALGQAPSNAAYRFDPSSYALWYPQRPLLTTIVSDHLRKGADSGQMVWIGIGPWDGFNVEDSLIFNKASAERGLFRNTNCRSVRDEVKSHGDEKETLGLPPADCRSRLSMDYGHIDPATGLVRPGAILVRDSVVISKYVTTKARRSVQDPVTGEIRTVEETRVRDRSTHVRVREPVRVEEVLTTTTGDGNTLVRVRYCTVRQPKEGDKHACLTPDHQVLTRRGWVDIANIHSRTDEVAVSNGGQGVRYRALQGCAPLHCYDLVNTPLYRYTFGGADGSAHLGARVTLQHRLPVADRNGNVELREARCVFTGLGAAPRDDQYPRHLQVDAVGRVDGKDGPLGDGRDWGVTLETLYRALGLLAAHTTPANGSAYPTRRLVFGLPSEGLADAFEGLAANVKVEVRHHGASPHHHSVVTIELGADCNAPLPRALSFLEDLYGVLDGGNNSNLRTPYRVPPWALTLRAPLARAFLEGFCYGGAVSAGPAAGEGEDMAADLAYLPLPEGIDGDHLAADLAALCVHAGGGALCWGGDGVIKVQLRGAAPFASIDMVRGVHCETNYTGSVYCLSVPPEEIFCVRRRLSPTSWGAPTWTGNSRFGQKGVVGRVVASTDMPYDESSGLSPDIMINPHGQPSRMTVGHLLEVLLGHVATASGEFADGTPFTLSDAYADAGADPEAVVRNVRHQLEQLGFTRTDGKARMRDGRTGRRLKFDMYCGPQYYLALRHQVDDKIHSRSRGPVQMQTKQPVEGRHRDGGNRYGEMERDNSLAHGAPFFLMDRLVHCSDGDDIAVCERCGNMAQPPKPRTAGGMLYGATVHASQPFCHVCLTGDHVVNRVMPHAFALSIHQCAALHIGVKLRGEAALQHEADSVSGGAAAP